MHACLHACACTHTHTHTHVHRYHASSRAHKVTDLDRQTGGQDNQLTLKQADRQLTFKQADYASTLMCHIPRLPPPTHTPIAFDTHTRSLSPRVTFHCVFHVLRLSTNTRPHSLPLSPLRALRRDTRRTHPEGPTIASVVLGSTEKLSPCSTCSGSAVISGGGGRREREAGRE